MSKRQWLLFCVSLPPVQMAAIVGVMYGYVYLGLNQGPLSVLAYPIMLVVCFFLVFVPTIMVLGTLKHQKEHRLEAVYGLWVVACMAITLNLHAIMAWLGWA